MTEHAHGCVSRYQALDVRGSTRLWRRHPDGNLELHMATGRIVVLVYMHARNIVHNYRMLWSHCERNAVCFAKDGSSLVPTARAWLAAFDGAYRTLYKVATI